MQPREVTVHECTKCHKLHRKPDAAEKCCAPRLKFSRTLNTVWTDGGRASCYGYFDKVGHQLNNVLAAIFAGREVPRDEVALQNSVMDDVPYGTRCVLTFKVEVDGAPQDGDDT